MHNSKTVYAIGVTFSHMVGSSNSLLLLIDDLGQYSTIILR